MHSPTEPVDAPDTISFERAEFGADAHEPAVCKLCRAPIVGEHYTLAAAPLCVRCRGGLAALVDRSQSRPVFLRAIALGVGAMLAGSIAWYVIRRVTGYELGLVAVALGYVVARAVRRGSLGVGGRRYQVLAVALTYASIALSNAPDVVAGLADHGPHSSSVAGSHADTSSDPNALDGTTGQSAPRTGRAPAHGGVVAIAALVVFVLVVSLISPFLGGFQNIMGLAIIGFALYQAWKLTRGATLVIDGPFVTAPTTVARVDGSG